MFLLPPYCKYVFGITPACNHCRYHISQEIINTKLLLISTKLHQLHYYYTLMLTGSIPHLGDKGGGPSCVKGNKSIFSSLILLILFFFNGWTGQHSGFLSPVGLTRSDNLASLPLVGKSNGLHHQKFFYWQVFKIMGCGLKAMQFFPSFQSVQQIWIYFVAVCSPTISNFIE